MVFTLQPQRLRQEIVSGPTREDSGNFKGEASPWGWRRDVGAGLGLGRVKGCLWGKVEGGLTLRAQPVQPSLAPGSENLLNCAPRAPPWPPPGLGSSLGQSRT